MSMVVLFVSAIVLIPIPQVHAFNCSWSGTGAWTDGSHWSGCSGGVPGAGDSAVITSGTVTVTGTHGVLGVTVDSGATLTCDSSCTLTIGTDLTINSGGTVNNSGTITLPDGELTNSGTFNNHGTFTLPSGAGDILNEASGVIVNFGTITAGLGIFNSGTIANCGGTITAAQGFNGQLSHSGRCSMRSNSARISTRTARTRNLHDNCLRTIRTQDCHESTDLKSTVQLQTCSRKRKCSAILPTETLQIRLRVLGVTERTLIYGYMLRVLVGSSGAHTQNLLCYRETSSRNSLTVSM